MLQILDKLKNRGKTIVGFGAPTKSTTLLSHFEISKEYLDYIVDDNPLKQGKFTPGFHIPIKNSNHIYEQRPDYILILAWNFAESIMKRHADFMKNGGKFIIPMPKASIL